MSNLLKSRLLRRSAVAPAKRVLGIDPSLTSTGYAYWDTGTLMTGRITTDPLRGPNRLFYVRMKFEKLLSLVNPDLVCFEDYAFAAKGNNMFNIGELGGVLKTHSWENGFDYVCIPPTVMKSVIALDGGAKKDEISLALKSRFNIDIKQHDEADAAGLLLIGEMRCGARRPAPKVGKSDRFAAVMDCAIVIGKPPRL